MLWQESKGLKVIEDDEDEEEEDRVVEAEGLGLFEEPPEDAGAKTFFRENAASKFKKSLQRAKKHAHDDKMAVATKVGWKSLLPNDAPGKKGSVKSKTGEKQAETSLSLKLGSTKIGSQAKSLQAALKMRQKVQTSHTAGYEGIFGHSAALKMRQKVQTREKERRRDTFELTKVAVVKVQTREKERRRDSFELTKVAVVDVSSQQVDGTDIQGWNRGPSKTVTWSNIYIYIIRAHGDCQREVHEVYTVVLPKIRETMLAAHCQVHVRDLGVWAPSMEEERAPEASRPAISHALAAVSEPNALRLILLGKDYGLPWAQVL
ncbi:hypothetical protein T484DRAFT_1826912 [Baffinella frigidus]|nr:hypothetical protein T484DRAFT_1826912 [Cryptophyta sp. CCMP2293]